MDLLGCGRTISIHGPRVGADSYLPYSIAIFLMISIHGPRVGADASEFDVSLDWINFNPRPPCGGRPDILQGSEPRGSFQSTAPVWGPTLLLWPENRGGHISIHGPRVGADWRIAASRRSCRRFQSTAPVWGPTVKTRQSAWDRDYFNPRPPCGGRRDGFYAMNTGMLFQSTAPVWGPTRPNQKRLVTPQFQSTAPVWGPTVVLRNLLRLTCISIHGPRVGADPCWRAMRSTTPGFQSTAPVWGPTVANGVAKIADIISIHGPRVGADEKMLISLLTDHDFNPRPPCGGRPVASP